MPEIYMETPSSLLSSHEPICTQNQETLSTQLYNDDPLIQKLLSTRQQMTDVSEQDEQERQNRMYVMLRHSRKYRKMQVAQANDRWEKHSSHMNFSDLLDEALAATEDTSLESFSESSSTRNSTSKRKEKVTFNDKIEVITFEDQTTMTSRLPKQVQLLLNILKFKAR